MAAKVAEELAEKLKSNTHVHHLQRLATEYIYIWYKI